jgi:hypothetical protein
MLKMNQSTGNHVYFQWNQVSSYKTEMIDGECEGAQIMESGHFTSNGSFEGV